MTPLVAVVTALAVYRLTLLVVADAITEPARSWLIGRLWARSGARPARRRGETWDEIARRTEDLPKPVVLLICPWCMSVWLAGPAVAVTLAWSDGWGWWWAASTLAASAATGLLASVASPAG